MPQVSKFLIGAASSGSGKTTLTLGLARALHKRGLNVQPFKCGPDYIDTKYHDVAADNLSVNLDLFLASEAYVREIYARHGRNKDVCITEGVMGLFDGADKMRGSSAHIAQLLDIPVVLVVNAAAMAYSAAPLLYGYKNFRQELNIAGVVFNFVAGESHYRYLCEACADVGLTPLGWLTKNAGIAVPSRHLGLSLEHAVAEFADKAAMLVEQQIDIDQLLELTSQTAKIADVALSAPAGALKIAVARDTAFNFTYRENLHALERLGAVTYFSPLNDTHLPEADLVYLPGGYPELHLAQLSSNTAMHAGIRAYVENDGKLWAECGGMLYLCDALTDQNGKTWPMTGIFRQQATMQPMKLKLGYRSFTYNNTLFKGHEFHYSAIEKPLPTIAEQFNAKCQPVDTALWRYKNALASYTHLYWAEHNNFLDLFR